VELYKENGISENKLFLGYYGGYGGDTCEEYAKSNNIIHNEYNIPQENTTIGMVSYVYKPKWFALQRRGIKGHEDFIDALEIVRKKHPKITGVIIGDAWGNSQKYFDKIKIYAKENSKADIIFTDYRSDIKDIYCELDVVVHPSHSENLGGAAESLAAARPTISTNVGGFRDIVIDNKTGKLVPPKNPQKLAEAIIVVIENYENAQKMANEGQKLVRELLDIDKCTECIIDAYKNILGV
jgi:glycosyltransferase involved in cell wall biosynthesis